MKDFVRCIAKPQAARGFTLLELILVMLIISIAMAVVAPILGNVTRGRRVDDAARHVVALANYARSQAITDGRQYRLNFDVNGYWLTAQAGGKFENLGTEYGQTFALPDDLKLQTDVAQTDGGAFVTFKPDGRIEPAPANVRVTDSDRGVAMVTCESATELFHVVKNTGGAK